MATFMSLPAELRILIWQYSMPDPRRPVLSWSGTHFAFNTTPPNLVHVCHESREEAAKQYELTFATPGNNNPHIWFDFTRDFLYVTDEALARLPGEVVRRIQNLRHFRYTGKMALKCSS
ncbi:Hypothetical predicted protein [Lecanosticta acicola]|uniref:2EXR domain-containing protein n=1 Tax=Lecanosticta acicola TaxID=111012 RepID=A0AAI8YU28_9PEZI|nr:Hypothetical predicted protein [Lecanosticta acicola]